LLTLHNSTVLLPSMQRLVNEFVHLFSRRAFVHWFVAEGMDEDEFGQALNLITDLRDLYNQVTKLPPASSDYFPSVCKPIGCVKKFNCVALRSTIMTQYYMSNPGTTDPFVCQIADNGV
uniref:Tubulin_C domain-containing protein n=1 Tax=Echinostoma caproni TaxID=27848 RepID=A0A183BAG4_9TREM